MKAMHLDDRNTSPLHVSMLKHPVPPSIQFISCGHFIGVRKQAFLDVHDKERKKAYGVHFVDAISFESMDIIKDWTSENHSRIIWISGTSIPCLRKAGIDQ